MGAAKRYEQFEAAILDAIGPQGRNASEHFRAVMLCPGDITKFDSADRAAFRTELWRLIGDTHHRWATERFWHSPQGRICRELDDYPPLRKYLRSVNLEPLVGRGAPRPWPGGQP